MPRIIKDDKTRKLAKQKLIYLLSQQTEQYNIGFFTWAWEFRACLNQPEYEASSDKLRQGAEQLTRIYQQLKTQAAQSDALWAWVMHLLAAAKANYCDDYKDVKTKIMNIAGAKSIANALTTGLLLRNAELDHFQSNDFAALALAMVCYAAAIAGDKEIFVETLEAAQVSVMAAKQESATAEYILAILYLQLAELALCSDIEK